MRRRALAWLLDHRRVAAASLVQLLSSPLSTLLTALVIGIALSLPAGLLLGLDNARRLTEGWDGAARLSLFLGDGVSERAGRAMTAELAALPDIDSAHYISRSDAMIEFGELSGFGELLSALPENPLPAVIVLTPQHALLQAGEGAARLQALQRALRERPGVELAQLDLEWVQRLYALMALARQFTLALALVLALAVLLVTGNTIRLTIENRRDEIVVVKLVGGTDAFVRRPFLYTGLWYGLAGGLLAWLLTGFLLLALKGPVSGLAGLYGSQFSLQALAPADALSLIFGGMLLGFGGAWLAVARHLGDIAPR